MSNPAQITSFCAGWVSAAAFRHKFAHSVPLGLPALVSGMESSHPFPFGPLPVIRGPDSLVENHLAAGMPSWGCVAMVAAPGEAKSRHLALRCALQISVWPMPSPGDLRQDIPRCIKSVSGCFSARDCSFRSRLVLRRPSAAPLPLLMVVRCNLQITVTQ